MDLKRELILAELGLAKAQSDEAGTEGARTALSARFSPANVNARTRPSALPETPGTTRGGWETALPRVAKHRYVSELALAWIGPPALTIATVFLTVGWLENSDAAGSFRSHSHFLMPLMIPGAAVVAAVILLDLRLVEKLPAATSVDARLSLYVSALVSLMFMAVGVTAETAPGSGGEIGALVMFICLPMLLFCTPLLWFSARAIQRVSHRLLLLTGFVLATVWTEWQCQTENVRGNEDRVVMFHSLLFALVVAIRLCTWSARAFRNA